ncbi:hypothetical protein ACFWV1_06840 [Streptomyces sp. NPDC058700]|uniref:DUF7848 domain-containing protein n=1 Tax=unclassified Streptomyces TaxID=2593676 RepID=UPI00364760BE
MTGACRPAVPHPRLWVLRQDPTGSGPITEAECTTCLDGSGAADDGRGPAVWCLAHAQATGHTGFRRVRTDFFRASCDGRRRAGAIGS